MRKGFGVLESETLSSLHIVRHLPVTERNRVRENEVFENDRATRLP